MFQNNIIIVLIVIFIHIDMHIWEWEERDNFYLYETIAFKIFRVPWTARKSNQSILKEISPEYLLKDWCWSWNSNTLATWWEELTHLKRPWCCERLKAGGEGDNRRWDGCMASPTWWTSVWASSRGWRWTGKPGVLQSVGSQRVGHDWVTELTDWGSHVKYYPYNREEQNQS